MRCTVIHPRASWIRVSYAMRPNPDIQTLSTGVVAFHVHVVLHNDTKGTIEIPLWDQPEQLADIRAWERSGTPIHFLWCKC